MTTRTSARIFVGFWLWFFSAWTFAAQAPSLEDVLKGMDGVSGDFRDMSADIERETVTLFINHSRFESGQMYYVRSDGASRIRVALTDPAPKDFLVADGKARIYNPATNVVEEIELGEHQDKVEFMVLGFGTSRADLLAYYEVSLVGQETLDGQVVSVLDLTPRDPAVLRHFTSIRLWMDQQRWLPVQTKATQPSGDYLTVRFSNVRINTHLADGRFDLHLPDDVQIVRP